MLQAKRFHFFLDLLDLFGILRMGNGSIDPGRDFNHVFFFQAARGDRGRADADAARNKWLLRIERDGIFVHGDPGVVEQLFQRRHP